jgi:hypothetical protein
MPKLKADPMRTKSNKVRLGPLNVHQLTEMLKSALPKHRAKIQHRIDTLVNKYGHKPLATEVDKGETQ